MTLDQCLIVARKIDAVYLEPICSRIEISDNPRAIQHLRWMVQKMHNHMPKDKAMRWLGYIQGILVGCYDISLASMKNLVNDASKD